MPHKGAFGQEISDSWQAVADALTAYQAAKDRKTGHLLAKAIAANFRAPAGVQRSEICPMLGMIDGLCRVGQMRFVGRFVTRVLIAGLRLHPQLSGPNFCGWNDFEMGGWMIAHDPYYTARIYERLGNTRGMVQSTCSWMVKSVREQEPEFERQWVELDTAERARRAFEGEK